MAMTYNNKTRRRPHIAQAVSERRLVFFYPFAKLFIQFPAFSFYSYFIDFAGVI